MSWNPQLQAAIEPLFGAELSAYIAQLSLPRLPPLLALDIRLKGGDKEWTNAWVVWGDEGVSG
jgi:hypothetical protein